MSFEVVMPPKRQTKGVLLCRNIPPEVKRLFKSTAVRRGVTMQDAIVLLMKAYIENPGRFEK